MMKEKEELRAQFLKIYPNLPLGVRKGIICVLDDWGSMSWNVCYTEIEQETKVGWQILEKLRNLEII